MKKAILSILLEFQERDIPKPIFRMVYPPPFSKGLRKAWVLMGMRRSGKTWIAYQQINLREKQGFPKNTNLYINFEDDRLTGFELKDFQTILDVYYELYPQNVQRKDLFFCFDEIHVVPGWEKFIRRLLDTEDLEICITGSSAGMLSRELGTTLGGRALPEEVFPFSFSEFLRAHDVEAVEKMSSKTKAQVRHLATEYLLYGGFPETVLGPKELHAMLIQGYMDAVVLRDIVKRYSISNANILQKFLVRILRQLAAPLSVTKIYNEMKSMGLQIGKNTLFDYLQYFEDAYALLAVPFFSLSERVRQVNPKKVYAVDPGIITAYSVKNGFERASRLENAVFMHIRRSFTNVCYYKTERHKKEVDFVVTKPNGELFLVQAAVHMDDAETRSRELSALLEACAELHVSCGTIVTEDHEEEIQQEGITIHCVPFWRWAQASLKD